MAGGESKSTEEGGQKQEVTRQGGKEGEGPRSIPIAGAGLQGLNGGRRLFTSDPGLLNEKTLVRSCSSSN